jgi:hypothetical protein
MVVGERNFQYFLGFLFNIGEGFCVVFYSGYKKELAEAILRYGGLGIHQLGLYVLLPAPA